MGGGRCSSGMRRGGRCRPFCILLFLPFFLSSFLTLSSFLSPDELREALSEQPQLRRFN